MISKAIKKVKKIPNKIKGLSYLKSEAKGNTNSSNVGIDTLTHVTYCKVGNAGDTVLSKCVRKNFERYMNVNWYLQKVTQPVGINDVNTFNRTRGVIIGGGGLFLPDTNTNLISGWQWAISKELLRAIDKPIIVYSVGYNYFPGQEVTSLFCDNLIKLVEKASFVGLRNNGSVSAIRQLLPDYLKEKVIYQPCTTTIIRRLFEGIPAKKLTRNIAINVAFDREDRRYGDDKDKILTQLAYFANKVSNRGYNLYVVYHCSSDIKFKPYLDKAGVVYQGKDLSNAFPDEVFAFYNSMDLVCGMRGHAQMIPFGLNCEIISLGTHDKMRWFLEDIDSVDWYINLREDPDLICERLMSMFINIHEIEGDKTTQRLLEKQQRLLQISDYNMQTIYKLLN